MSGQASFLLARVSEENNVTSPATAVLASAVFEQRLSSNSSISPAELANADQETHHLSTSLPVLDTSVLHDGGFAYGSPAPGSSSGEVVSIAFEGGARSATSSIFLHSLLAAHLVPLSSPSLPSSDTDTSSQPGLAFYIDTTGDFSALLLYELVLYRLRLRQGHESAGKTFTHSGGYVYSRARPPMDRVEVDQQLEEQAKHLLDRVSCMRVLDFIGVMEAIGEIQELLGSGVGTVTMDDAHVQSPQRGPEDTTIADSQADPDADDMLDWPASPAPRQSHEDSEEARRQIDAAGAAENARLPPAEGPPLIVLPSLPTHLTPEMHSSYVRAHALLEHLMRSLRALCQPPPGACVVITNTAVSVSAQNPSARRDATEGEETGPSAFASKSHLLPALGRTYAQLVDLSLMVTAWKRESNSCVVEVLGDARGAKMAVDKQRRGIFGHSRVGKWSVFSVADGTLKDIEPI